MQGLSALCTYCLKYHSASGSNVFPVSDRQCRTFRCFPHNGIFSESASLHRRTLNWESDEAIIEDTKIENYCCIYIIFTRGFFLSKRKRKEDVTETGANYRFGTDAGMKCAVDNFQKNTASEAHSKPCFPAPSSKLCHSWLRH